MKKILNGIYFLSLLGFMNSSNLLAAGLVLIENGNGVVVDSYYQGSNGLKQFPGFGHPCPLEFGPCGKNYTIYTANPNYNSTIRFKINVIGDQRSNIKSWIIRDTSFSPAKNIVACDFYNQLPGGPSCKNSTVNSCVYIAADNATSCTIVMQVKYAGYSGSFWDIHNPFYEQDNLFFLSISLSPSLGTMKNGLYYASSFPNLTTRVGMRMTFQL